MSPGRQTCQANQVNMSRDQTPPTSIVSVHPDGDVSNAKLRDMVCTLVQNMSMMVQSFQAPSTPIVQRLIVHMHCPEGDKANKRKSHRSKRLRVEPNGQNKESVIPPPKPPSRPTKVTKTNPQSSAPGNRLPPPCTRCGRKHLRECRVGMRICYKCGQPGHRIMECPSSTKGCFDCGKMGHSIKDRPAKAQTARSPQPQQAKVGKAVSLGALSGNRTYPLCAECGRHHLGECRMELGICFACNQLGHMANECPLSTSKECFRCGKPGHKVKDCPYKSKKTSARTPHASATISGRQNRLYDADIRQEQSADIVTGTLRAFDFDYCVLLDPSNSNNLSFVPSRWLVGSALLQHC